MQFVDYSPPLLPSIEQQLDALKKGLGRAVQWATSNRLDEATLLNACLHDLRYDFDVEDARGVWLWRLIHISGQEDHFREPILAAISDYSNERSGQQLTQLAAQYAAAGDSRFRSKLYELIEQKPFVSIPWIAEEEVMSIDGESGFLFAAHVRDKRLAKRDIDWDDFNLLDLAVGKFGEERVKALLETDASFNKLKDGWKAQQLKRLADGGASYRRELQNITIEDIIRAAESGDKKYPRYRGWGNHASIPDLEIVLNRLIESTDPTTIINYLKVFSGRALLRFNERVAILCRHENEEVRRRTFNALEKLTHPAVRELALSELRKGIRDGYSLSLFIKNQAGDENILLESIVLPADECQLHHLLMAITKVFEANPQADATQLGLVAYALTPCSNCRLYAARILNRQQVTPAWLKTECETDSVDEIRDLNWS